MHLHMHRTPTSLLLRYGRVICCIGVNPNKTYDVTPKTRAGILREMLSGSNDGNGKGCKNVQVEGTISSILCLFRFFFTALFLIGFIANRFWSEQSGGRVHMEIRPDPKRNPLLSRDTHLGRRWAGGTDPPNTQHVGTDTVRAAGVAAANDISRGRSAVS